MYATRYTALEVSREVFPDYRTTEELEDDADRQAALAAEIVTGLPSRPGVIR